METNPPNDRVKTKTIIALLNILYFILDFLDPIFYHMISDGSAALDTTIIVIINTCLKVPLILKST